jgi:two-component system chemotaxis sensor kinase CheA
MSRPFDAKEFLAGYLAEADDWLSAANASLVAIDAAHRAGEHNPRAVRELFRALHTLKGLSGMVGAEPVVELSHGMETVVRAADRAGGRLAPGAFDVLLRALRAIDERIRELGAGKPISGAPQAVLDSLANVPSQQARDPSAFLAGLDPALASKLSAAEQEQLLVGVRQGRRAVRADFRPSTDKAQRGVTITSVRERVGRIAELVKVLPLAEPVSEQAPGGLAFVLLIVTELPDEVIAEAAATSVEHVQTLAVAASLEGGAEQEGPADRPRHNFVRVDVARLDDALDRLSEVVVGRSRLQRAIARLQRGEGGSLPELSALAAESGRQLRGLRAAIMSTRMVPMAELLDRTPLIVRGLAQASGKSVRLSVEAGRAELDKAVADRVFPAIVHLLRNAVDHAIEPPQERAAAGKDPEALIRIVCAPRSNNQVELMILDDGRGMDRERIARAASAPVPESDDQLLELIARPGLSTLQSASATSGRGMGMNIVKRIAVDELGGELQLRTVPGRGTSFRMRLPLTITIIDAFSFECAGRTFVAPVAAVSDLAELEPSRLSCAPQVDPAAAPVRVLQHRGAVLPLLSLREVLGLSHAPPDRSQAMIVRSGEQEAIAFEVDRMVGQQEVVVRPLRDPLVRVPGVSGSADLGDGRPTLVLDLAGLARRVPLRQGTAA